MIGNGSVDSHPVNKLHSPGFHPPGGMQTLRQTVVHIAATVLCVLAGCSRPPAVEYENLKYIQLLRTAVSSRSLPMVDKIAEAIDRLHREQNMSDVERSHFQSIIAIVKEGNWQEADRLAFEFEEAQISRSRKPRTESKRPQLPDHHKCDTSRR